MSSSPLVVLTERDVRRLLTLDAAIESQRACFRALGSGEAVLPARLLVEGAEESMAFCYAARLRPDAPAVSKFGSVNPGNAAAGLPVVNAAVLVLDPATGMPAALMDGTSVTEIRTAAASAVAAEALAPRARTLAVLGTGVQGLAHARAITRTHALDEIRVWGRDTRRREEAAAALTAELDTTVVAAGSAEAAVRGADLVALCTTSTTPVIETAWCAPGTTVISVGSFAPDRHEYAQDLLTTAGAVVVDDLETAEEHAGPVAQALREGTLERDAVATLGEVLVGARPGRGSAEEIVLYNSVGIGAQDAAAAGVLLDLARGSGDARVIDLSG